MNLVQKLPLGLGLACLMFMSSCSKEDAPTPGSAVTNESSNLRQGGPVFVPVTYLPSTDGPTCEGCTVKDWYFLYPGQGATSSLTAYAGNPSKKWVQALPAPSIGVGSFITVTHDAAHPASAFGIINNLVKGKKYRITFSASTTSLNEAYGQNAYSSSAKAFLNDIPVEKEIDFTGKHNQWITETLEFVATKDVYVFNLLGYTAQGETKLTYTNLHVGKNAVQQIN